MDYTSCPIVECKYLSECVICRLTIVSGEKYYDGGFGERAHVKCVRGRTRNRVVAALDRYTESCGGNPHTVLRPGSTRDIASKAMTEALHDKTTAGVAAVWAAVNQYVVACGGDPEKGHAPEAGTQAELTQAVESYRRIPAPKAKIKRKSGKRNRKSGRR